MRQVKFRLRLNGFFFASLLVFFQGFLAPGFAVEALPNGVRVIDSATGCAIPESELMMTRAGNRLVLTGPNYRLTELALPENIASPYRINVVLDPLNPPAEFSREHIDALRHSGHMVIVGFISDDRTAVALEGVKVSAEPGGVVTSTDARGFFQLLVPVGNGGGNCRLEFTKPGFLTQRRDYVEVWPDGDWMYRVALKPGKGVEVVDERLNRRISSVPADNSTRIEPLPSASTNQSNVSGSEEGFSDPPEASGSVSAASSEDFVVRVPRTIRVLRQDDVTIDYLSLETYTKRVLPSEWVASWANFSGGINCLKAGAVAIRTFAAGYVSNPRAFDYDICGTSACQAYNPSANNSLANSAVDQTIGYVMVLPGAERITYKLTEYSAENNSTNFPCGDGYTSPTTGCLADPVCAGETRFGHGRGMCQWGSAKWATGLKFPGNDFPLDGSTTNGLPKQDWVWICEHYYPHLELVPGMPLEVGDFVKVLGTSSLEVRECAGGSISSGTGCPLIATKLEGSTGTIIGGPVWVVAGDIGYTWWRVRWFDGSSTEGWSPENWLERTTEPPNAAPVLADVPPQIVNEGELLTITNVASAPANIVHTIADFENFTGGTVNGTVMFRQPTFSGSTSAQLATSPNESSVTDSFPAGNGSSRVLNVNWSWLSVANPWLRLTTFNATSIGNPVIALDRTLSFDIHTDRDLRVAVGVRETGNAVGTPIGSDGGSSGGIETVGATNATSTPAPVRTVTAGSWTTLTFDLPAEPVRSLASGNGVLSTPTGLATIENLSFVPAAGAGEYDVHLDSFVLSASNVLTYSLSNAPAGMQIDPGSGVLTWTPTESQGPGVFDATVIVTDNNLPPMSDAITFSVTVNEVNVAPVLAAISNRTVHAGSTVSFVAQGSDVDEPENSLSFSLDPGAPAGASVGASDGQFDWTTTPIDAGTSNAITLRVTDNGSPVLSDTKTFGVIVEPVPAFQTFAGNGGTMEITWNAIPGTSYRVQYKTNLNQTAWIDLVTDVAATTDTVSVIDPIGEGERYYRVLVLD